MYTTTDYRGQSGHPGYIYVHNNRLWRSIWPPRLYICTQQLTIKSVFTKQISCHIYLAFTQNFLSIMVDVMALGPPHMILLLVSSNIRYSYCSNWPLKIPYYGSEIYEADRVARSCDESGHPYWSPLLVTLVGQGYYQSFIMANMHLMHINQLYVFYYYLYYY